MAEDNSVKTSTSTPLQIVPYFGGFILETLTVGMYGESRNAIREYIQNGFDSIQKAIKMKILKPDEGLIELKLPGDQKSLTIRDNGAGLPAESAAATLTSVGSSSKDYRKTAGFRGIGRLAGIVFSEKVTFTTKARGETTQTKIVFDAFAMRQAMSPEEGSAISAETLIKQCVSGIKEANLNLDDHFFEVKLEGLTDPPEECVSFHKLEEFVSQVAPVPYSAEFKCKQTLLDAAAKYNIPIDEVRISIEEGDKGPRDVMKPYVHMHKMESREVPLDDCEILDGPSAKWWGWVGKKTESGAFDEAKVSGIRIRVKNIQIDGTQIFREIFQRQQKSYVRFTEYFLGEIFVEPSWLVPNARRDGFEEDPNWKTMRLELGGIAKRLGKQSYDISTEAQRTVGKLKERLEQANRDMDVLRRSNFSDPDRVLALTVNITRWKGEVDKASADADRPTLAQLNEIGSSLLDIKTECLKRIGTVEKPDLEEISLHARDELVQELMALFEDRLSPKCVTEVRSILREYLGQPDL